MRRNLYIDTNVYLTFFHFSNDDLKELQKLVYLISTGNIKLYVPEQTLNEFQRNREIKIHDAISNIREAKLPNNFPMICHSYDEYAEMKKALKEYETSKAKLLTKLQRDAEEASLKADEVLNDLIQKAEILETTQPIIGEAVMRFNMGNPPGKDRSYGDAINWVSLLNGVDQGEDIYFISGDKDFYSKLNDKKFNDYLIREWERVKNSDLFYYKKLSDFFKDKYPDIEINSDTEKEIVINNLAEAFTFAQAKKAIKALLQFESFSIKQVNKIAEIYSTNNQIYGIKSDWIVNKAKESIIDKNIREIEPEILKKFKREYR